MVIFNAKNLKSWRRSDPFGLDNFKFFVPLLAGLLALLFLAANSIFKLSPLYSLPFVY